MRRLVLTLLCGAFAQVALGQAKSLYELQQDFVDLRLGLFTHMSTGTFLNEDWGDPDASPEVFNPTKMDCGQWAKAAKSANMTWGCLSVKHHAGFCLWDTKTTDYNSMNSSFNRDVVKEYTDAFHAAGLKVSFHYSVLDLHQKIRPGYVSTMEHTQFIKDQIYELLTNYGEVTAFMFDGWDVGWGRISYQEIPFEDIYCYIKSLQPNCLVLDLNAAKYPTDALFYTDIKSYEQGAGQHISKDSNRLPAVSMLPLQETWFWKEGFQNATLKSAESIVNDNIIPMGKVHCNFLLNVGPNKDGLLDKNAVDVLKQIGKLWKNDGKISNFPIADAPIISSNIAINMPIDSSWGNDTSIMDFANDDSFSSAWWSNPAVKDPWMIIYLEREKPLNMIVLTEASRPRMSEYTLEYRQNNVWKPIVSGTDTGRVKIHRFDTVWGDAVRLKIQKSSGNPSVAELGIYNERR